MRTCLFQQKLKEKNEKTNRTLWHERLRMRASICRAALTLFVLCLFCSAEAQVLVWQDLFQDILLPKWNTSVMSAGSPPPFNRVRLVQPRFKIASIGARYCTPDPLYSASGFFVAPGDNCTQHFVPSSFYSSQSLAQEGITFQPTLVRFLSAARRR